eukprot:3803971-Prymnesium_polylepis.1
MPVFYKGAQHPDFPAEDCPETMRALSTMRLAGETVAFQRQSPGTGLPRHVDPCSWVLACHLGVTCPDEAGVGSPYISVAGQKYHWKVCRAAPTHTPRHGRPPDRPGGPSDPPRRP